VSEFRTDQPWIDSVESPIEESREAGKRRRWPIAVVAFVVVIVAIGAALYVAASHYQPLDQSIEGSYGAQVLASNGSLAANHINSAGSTRMIWTEPAGSFLVEVVVSLNNNQRFGVTIDKVLAPANPSGTSNVHVFFDSSGLDVGNYGYKGGPTFKPTALASKGSLTLALHWNQQCVPASAQSAATTYTSLPVEYTFLGFRHTVNVPIEPLTIRPRPLC
jgi:hypothetical protein